MSKLLLGLAPVVHLLSSHLKARDEQEGKAVGTVGRFMANNPTFTKTLTVGAGIRAAMKLMANGPAPVKAGIGSAIKMVAKAIL